MWHAPQQTAAGQGRDQVRFDVNAGAGTDRIIAPVRNTA
jgi:argininosuccinate synthase